MTRFIDEYLPECVNSYNAVSSPRFSTGLVVSDGGAEQVNQHWAHPLYDFSIPQGVRDMETMFAVRDHFLIMKGPYQTFPFSDPLDFASVNPTTPGLAPTLSALDQTIGTGNGATTQFQLIKNYTVGSQNYARPVYHPVVSSVLISINGVPQGSGWTVSRTTGIVTFDVAPANGLLVKAGYLFDVQVRYDADNSFDAIAASVRAGGYADIPLKQVRIC